MTVYVYVMLALMAGGVASTPYMMGKVRGREFAINQVTTFLAMIPVFGRALGWW